MEFYFDLMPEELIVKIMLNIPEFDIISLDFSVRLTDHIYDLYFLYKFGKLGYPQIKKISHSFRYTFMKLLFKNEIVKIPILYHDNIISHIPNFKFEGESDDNYIFRIFNSDNFLNYNYFIFAFHKETIYRPDIVVYGKRDKINNIFSWISYPRNMNNSVVLFQDLPFNIINDKIFEYEPRIKATFTNSPRGRNINTLDYTKLLTYAWMTIDYRVDIYNPDNLKLRRENGYIDTGHGGPEESIHCSDRETLKIIMSIIDLTNAQLIEIIRNNL